MKNIIKPIIALTGVTLLLTGCAGGAAAQTAEPKKVDEIPQTSEPYKMGEVMEAPSKMILNLTNGTQEERELDAYQCEFVDNDLINIYGLAHGEKVLKLESSESGSVISGKFESGLTYTFEATQPNQNMNFQIAQVPAPVTDANGKVVDEKGVMSAQIFCDATYSEESPSDTE